MRHEEFRQCQGMYELRTPTIHNFFQRAKQTNGRRMLRNSPWRHNRGSSDRCYYTILGSNIVPAASSIDSRNFDNMAHRFGNLRNSDRSRRHLWDAQKILIPFSLFILARVRASTADFPVIMLRKKSSGENPETNHKNRKQINHKAPHQSVNSNENQESTQNKQNIQH